MVRSLAAAPLGSQAIGVGIMDHRAEYVARINRVIDYIEAHVDEELSLEQLARVACFSPYHFHRIFGAMMGETLQRFIQRVRLERAANQLCLNPRRPITEVALDSGFASSATFARAFRAEFGMSASAWRKADPKDRKMGKTLRNGGKVGEDEALYLHPREGRSTMTKLDTKVEIRERRPERVAYLRHVGPYQSDEALFGRLFGRLAQWAGPRGLLGPSSQFLAAYHDNPEVTDADKLRVSVCVGIGDDVEVGGEIGAMEIPGGTYAVGTFRITPDQYPDAWTTMMSGWLPDSGYEPDDRICFECYLNDPGSDPEGKHDVEIWFPVRPL